MIRAIFGLITIAFCGLVFAAFQTGIGSPSIQELVKQNVERAAADAIPELQLQVIVAQMKQMCPVSYGADCTLIDVNVGEDMQIDARYVLNTSRSSIAKAEQERFRMMAIEQFKATGIGDRMIAEKISWKYSYESVDGRPLFELVVGPDDFAEFADQQFASASPSETPRLLFGSERELNRYPLDENSQPIMVVERDKVNDIFFSDSNVFGHRSSGANLAATSARTSREPSKVKSNPFAK